MTKNIVLTKNNLAKITGVCAVICASVGVVLCLINAQFDGYSHWSKRLLYFTTQSNLWLIVIKILRLLNNKSNNRTLFVCDYIFTVNITLTGLIFVFLLAPFADESYHVWSVSSYLTHVFAPVFAIVNFFLSKANFSLEKKEIFLCLIPGLIYSLITCLLIYAQLDFGRGETYPYFFYYYFSPAKVFGFTNIFPFYMGTFYWILIICLLMIVVGLVYSKHTKIAKDKNNKLLDRR